MDCLAYFLMLNCNILILIDNFINIIRTYEIVHLCGRSSYFIYVFRLKCAFF